MLSLHNRKKIQREFIISPRYDNTEVPRGRRVEPYARYVPGIELVYDALEAYDREEPRGEARNPGEQKNGKSDERAEAGGVRQRGGLHLLGRRSLVGEHHLRVGRRRGRR